MTEYADYAQIAILLKARGLPAVARSNGESDTVVIEGLSGQRVIFAAGEDAWGYTLVGTDGLVEVGWLEDLSSKAEPEVVANFIVDNIDWIFDDPEA